MRALPTGCRWLCSGPQTVGNFECGQFNADFALAVPQPKNSAAQFVSLTASGGTCLVGATPTPTPLGSCCAAHAGTGCDTPACQACVCGIDSFCCKTTGTRLARAKPLDGSWRAAHSVVPRRTFTPTPTPTISPTPGHTDVDADVDFDPNGNANAQRDAHSRPDADADVHADANTDADRHPHTDSDVHSHTDPNILIDADVHADPNRYLDAHPNVDPDRDADARGNAYGDPDAD